MEPKKITPSKSVRGYSPTIPSPTGVPVQAELIHIPMINELLLFIIWSRKSLHYDWGAESTPIYRYFYLALQSKLTSTRSLFSILSHKINELSYESSSNKELLYSFNLHSPI